MTLRLLGWGRPASCAAHSEAGLYSSEKLARRMHLNIAKIRNRGGRLRLNPMPMRLLFMKVLEGI